MKQMVVLGAGYAGMFALQALRRLPKNIALTLVEQNPYHTLEILLHEAAAHGKDVTLPLLGLLRGSQARLFPAKVQRVDLDNRTIHTDAGQLHYDYLLVALGSKTNFFGIPGLAEHATELKGIEDAEAIHDWLLRVYHPQYGGNREVLIGGAGLTGVELAAELALEAVELARKAGTTAGKVHLLEAGWTILPSPEEPQRPSAQNSLLHRGVEIHLGSKVTKAEAGKLHFADGSKLEGSLIVWTGGIQAQTLVQGEKLELGPAGRVRVENTLQVKHYPEVFAAGDIALALDAQGQPTLTTAQHAMHQGKIAGRNLVAVALGCSPKPYAPSTLGEFVSLGGLLAVGWMNLGWAGRLRLFGHIAGLVKRASEWRYLWNLYKPQL